MFLEKITAYKLEEIKAAKSAKPYRVVEEEAKVASPPRGFEAALRAIHKTGKTALIAEIKKASPSKGLIRADFDPATIAKAYEIGGAACLSVLTDTPSFQGAGTYLTIAREATNLPVLRKDFIYDVYQIAEARALGADAILIIIAAVSPIQAKELVAAAHSFNMDTLFEVHNKNELDVALSCEPTLLGINNRDLHNFETSLEVSKELLPHVPEGIFSISESGITNPDDIRALSRAGANGFLVGESLMRADNIAQATSKLGLALSADSR